jgi:hypothetical protein
MQSANLNGAIVGSYLYNGFAQRVQKTAGTTVTDFVYDRFGHTRWRKTNGATGAAQNWVTANTVPQSRTASKIGKPLSNRQPLTSKNKPRP